MPFSDIAEENMEALSRNTYPGRGIVIGAAPDGERFIQVYWIMGRSENSQNRIFVQERDTVRTQAYDESKVEDPSLIIYPCIKTLPRCHIVSNGDQTDTIFDAVRAGRTFEEAMFTRTFEPDEPNYTPRIAGIVNLNNAFHAYRLAIVKAVAGSGEYCQRHFFNYEKLIPGIGHCITTYEGDGDPLPAFPGEPYMLPLGDDIEETAERYWEALNEDNRISLLVKAIDPETDRAQITIFNKHE